VDKGHVHILQTPLFRVRNKKETLYCYDDGEKAAALNKLGKNAEITRFKGLGEISPDEFAAFIGKDIRLETVILQHDSKGDSKTEKILEYYMGKNTPARRDFIIENLKVEEDVVEEVPADFAMEKAALAEAG
jgi:topoisomerase IV subunit B